MNIDKRARLRVCEPGWQSEKIVFNRPSPAHTSPFPILSHGLRRQAFRDGGYDHVSKFHITNHFDRRGARR